MALAHEQHVESEHAGETHPSQPELPLQRADRGEELERLRGERDGLRDLVASYPRENAERLAELERQTSWDRRAASQARKEAERARAAFERMGPLARRPEDGRARQSYAEDNEQRAKMAAERERGRLEEIERVQAQPDSPLSWEREHPRARDQLQASDQQLDQALNRHADRQIQEPGEHLTRVLGERPAEREVGREACDRGAHAVERYRIAHQLDPAEPTALGSYPSSSAATGSNTKTGAAQATGSPTRESNSGSSRHELASTEERLARVRGLMPEEGRQRHLDRGQDRGAGFEL